MNGLSEFAAALRFARRELRGGLSGFRIFVACLALGVAAIAGVNSLSQAVEAALRSDARELAGGDIVVRTTYSPATDDQQAWFEAAGSVAQSIEMRAMAVTPERQTLVEMKAVDAAYPIYGTVELEPAQKLDAALAERDGRWGAAGDPILLQQRGLSPEVIDGGVSGDTTAGGLARIDWLLAEKPTHALVSLGANDALRGLPPEQAYNNLDAMLTKLEQAGVDVLLAGMYAPPNLGADYGRAFADIYKRLAEKHDVPLYPFFLDGVARDPALNQADGIHPNAKGVEIMVERLMPHVVSLLNGAAG